jgi:hypothetical protein
VGKRVFRSLLIAYPFVAGVLYLLLAYGPSQHLSGLQSKIKGLQDAKPAVIRRARLKDKRESQIQDIRRRIADFRRRANNMSLAQAPGYIYEKAAAATMDSKGGLEPESITTLNKTRKNGWLYCSYDLKVNGPFYSLVSFLRSMERDKEHYVRVRRASLSPTGSGADNNIALKAGVDILLEIPPMPPDLEDSKRNAEEGH